MWLIAFATLLAAPTGAQESERFIGSVSALVGIINFPSSATGCVQDERFPCGTDFHFAFAVHAEAGVDYPGGLPFVLAADLWAGLPSDARVGRAGIGTFAAGFRFLDHITVGAGAATMLYGRSLRDDWPAACPLGFMRVGVPLHGPIELSLEVMVIGAPGSLWPLFGLGIGLWR